MTPYCEPRGKFPAPTEASGNTPLTVLSYGLGQDSWAMLLMYAFDEEFRARYAPGRFLVLSAETGDEHPETYEHLTYSQEFCRQHGIEYVHITPDMGHHPKTWPGLREQYRKNNTVGSKTFRKSCTDNLKLVPIYNFLDEWIGKEYNLPSGRKEGIKLFAQKYGKIDMLVGLAAREEKRCADAGKDPAKWRRCSVRIGYPLIELGMDRGSCQDYARSVDQPVPPPSNCMLCPYMNDAELVWLERFYPGDFQDWVEIEANKLEAHQRLGAKNMGVWGKKTLTEALEEAKAKFGHWTDEALKEYKFSHGHSVASKY